jgi:glycosyltransferase involved in cell wall biosynthesis
MGGLSINDAMFFQLPIICSVCDGTEKKLVREGYNGLYFKEGSEDDLVDKIRYLFSNSVLRRQMGINSRKIIDEEINIHTVVKGYMDAFLHVMGSGDDEEGCRSYKNV